MRKTFYAFLLLVILISSCGGKSSVTAPSALGETETATPLLNQLPTPEIHTTSKPDAEYMAERFLEGWKIENYQAMYDLLASTSKDAISFEDFSKRYKDIAMTLTLQELNYKVLSSLTTTSSAQVAYHVTYKTSILGDFERDLAMDMAWENDRWLVKWDPALIMPELKGGNRIKIEYKVPARGEIYDRNGNTLVAQTTAYALGVVPSDIVSTLEGTLQQELAILTDQTTEAVFAQYKDAVGKDWYIAIGDAAARDVDKRMHILTGLLGSGLRMSKYEGRYYYREGVAPHVIGYAQAIPKEELEEYQRRGFRGDELVGQAGIEKWGDNYLSGEHGAVVYVTDAQGAIVTRLAEKPAVPAKTITTTIDQNLQIAIQNSITRFNTAVVVMERDTGRILAMASNPTFDPNLFSVGNINALHIGGTLFDTTKQPQMNRATQGLYPLGSVFKIITMAAALESKRFLPSTEYNCGYEFKELDGMTLYDWTKEKDYPPSGVLDLKEGLMRSCNPYFYHIGLDLYNQNMAGYLPDMARQFGLGSATGIEQVAEETGNVPETPAPAQAVQLAIGQSELLVTPVQVADYVAAVGNGGIRYRPQLVEKVTDVDGKTVFAFKPEIKGNLPVSEENLGYIKDAMRMVVEDKRGTAYNVFRGLGIKIHAKTGTASNENVLASHAFFAGYTDQKLENKPDIAIAVLAENAGEGSEVAAPIFRRVVELYFFGAAQKKFPWESALYVNATETPTPQPTTP